MDHRVRRDVTESNTGYEGTATGETRFIKRVPTQRKPLPRMDEIDDNTGPWGGFLFRYGMGFLFSDDFFLMKH